MALETRFPNGPWAGMPRVWWDSDTLDPQTSAPPGGGARVVGRAVHALGFTGTQTLGSPPQPVVLERTTPTCVMLTHGGPAAARTLKDRPVAAAAVQDPATGRTPRALLAHEWDDVAQAFITEARAARDAGATALGVECARGHLWHSALSPLLNGGIPWTKAVGPLVELLQEVHALGLPLAASVCLEEVTVGGLCAADGLGITRALYQAGVTLVVGRTGGPFMRARLHPPRPRFPHEEAPSLGACGWIKQALPQLLVLVGGAVAHSTMLERAVLQGLVDGGCVDVADLSAREVQPPPGADASTT